MLTSSTLQSWYTVAGIDIVTIGFLGLVGIPYILKFVWAPLLDRFIPLFLGKRRGWVFIAQWLIVLGLVLMAFCDPALTPTLMIVLAISVALCSATQDIAYDAYRAEILTPKERAFGAALSITGYRVAIIISGGIALIIADYFGWRFMYLLMALIMLLSSLVTLMAEEPTLANCPPQTLKQAIVLPFKDVLQKNNVWFLLLFIFFYRLGDAVVAVMSPTFLLRELQFSLSEVGTATKIIGLIATIIGLFIAGNLINRWGLLRSLFVFGICQGFSNLFFMSLSIVGKQYALMIVVIFTENLCAGMETAALVTFLMGLCNKNYTAAQYALFSALANMGRIVIGPIAGYLQVFFGWTNYFLIGFLATIPPLLILLKLRTVFSENNNFIASNA